MGVEPRTKGYGIILVTHGIGTYLGRFPIPLPSMYFSFYSVNIYLTPSLSQAFLLDTRDLTENKVDRIFAFIGAYNKYELVNILLV